MDKRQLDELFELTTDLNLIKRIADEDIYTIDFIIEFISLHRDLTSDEILYYINKFTNCCYDEIVDVSKNILLNSNYNNEDLKSVFDEIYSIDDLLKYDPRIELLKKNDIVTTLSSSELIKLLKSDINLLPEKVKLVDKLCKNSEIEKDEAFHNQINKIIENNALKEGIPRVKTVNQDKLVEQRNAYIKADIIKKISCCSDRDNSKIFEIKKSFDNIESFERLWSILHIIQLYEDKKQNLRFSQIELLIKLNAVLDSLSSSKLNTYFEDLELTKYRTFEEILAIAYKILPFRFYDNSLDVEQLLVHQSIVSKRDFEQSMYFVDELDKYTNEKHSYKGLKSLYDIALNVSTDFDVQKNQFNYVKLLKNDFDKECATKIFLTSKYTGTSFLECAKYIDEIVKCDDISKKKCLTDVFRFIFENENLTIDEKKALVKLIRKADSKTETKAVSEIVKYSKHLPLSDIYSLISLDEQSNASKVTEAQRDIKFVNSIKDAASREDMIYVFNSIPQSKSNGYFHF